MKISGDRWWSRIAFASIQVASDDMGCFCLHSFEPGGSINDFQWDENRFMCAEVDREIFRPCPLAVVRDDGRPMRLECCEFEVCDWASL
jgi:hypothetical protein